MIPRAPLFVIQKAVFSPTADIRYYKGPRWAQEVPSPFLGLSVGRKDLKIRKLVPRIPDFKQQTDMALDTNTRLLVHLTSCCLNLPISLD